MCFHVLFGSWSGCPSRTHASAIGYQTLRIFCMAMRILHMVWPSSPYDLSLAPDCSQIACSMPVYVAVPVSDVSRQRGQRTVRWHLVERHLQDASTQLFQQKACMLVAVPLPCCVCCLWLWSGTKCVSTGWRERGAFGARCKGRGIACLPMSGVNRSCKCNMKRYKCIMCMLMRYSRALSSDAPMRSL